MRVQLDHVKDEITHVLAAPRALQVIVQTHSTPGTVPAQRTVDLAVERWQGRLWRAIGSLAVALDKGPSQAC